AAASAALLLTPANFELVHLLGILEVLQGALLGRHRFLRLQALQVLLSALHFLNGLRQDFGDLLDRVLVADALIHLLDELLDLLPQLRLRQADENRVLLELVGRGLGAIALDVERRGDDLLLLLGERVDLILAGAASASAAAIALRLRLAEVLAERSD